VNRISRSLRLLALLATAAVLAVAGCGEDDDDGDGGGGGGDQAAETTPETTAAPGDAGGEASGPEQTVRNYLDGLGEGDGEKVCDQFTAEGRQEFDQIGGCADFFSGILSQLTEVQRNELRELDAEVEVDGERATARVPKLEGGGEETLNLAKEDGQWKITTTRGR
jgi:hypothetical protein